LSAVHVSPAAFAVVQAPLEVHWAQEEETEDLQQKESELEGPLHLPLLQRMFRL